MRPLANSSAHNIPKALTLSLTTRPIGASGSALANRFVREAVTRTIRCWRVTMTRNRGPRPESRGGTSCATPTGLHRAWLLLTRRVPTRGKDVRTIPNAFPGEFRQREAPRSRSPRTSGISEATLDAWLEKVRRRDGLRPGLIRADGVQRVRTKTGSASWRTKSYVGVRCPPGHSRQAARAQKPDSAPGNSAGNSAPRQKRPRKDSNLRTRFRKPMLFPLSYGGVTHTSSEWAALRRGANETSRWHTVS
jgi:hypothetical protein